MLNCTFGGGVFSYTSKFRFLKGPTKLEINAQADEEALKMGHKFEVWRKPFYERRNEVIGSIQEFWLVTFCNHPIIGNLITEEDTKILKNMVSLDVEEAHDVKSGFAISFSFLPNPYFEDEKLTKRYDFGDDGYLSVACKPINWKEGKGIIDGCSSEERRKLPHMPKSFFCWFSEAVRFDGEVDVVANIIRGDLWPNPLPYFRKKFDAVGCHGQEDSQGDTQDREELTGSGNEADDEDDNETEEENDEDYHLEDVGSCNEEDNGGEKHNKDYCAEDDEYDDDYHAEVDEDDDGDEDE